MTDRPDTKCSVCDCRTCKCPDDLHEAKQAYVFPTSLEGYSMGIDIKATETDYAHDD